jgi:hypothetical protein
MLTTMLKITRYGKLLTNTQPNLPKVCWQFLTQEFEMSLTTFCELFIVFMSANLVGGFHNRLEGSRKYLFGSAAVYGTANDSLISGAYMLRGSSAFPVSLSPLSSTSLCY